MTIPSPWCCHDAYANDKWFLFCITWTAEQLYFYFVLSCTHLYLMNGLGSDYLLSLLFQSSDDFFDAETSLTSGGARTRKNFEIKKNNLKNDLFSSSFSRFKKYFCSRVNYWNYMSVWNLVKVNDQNLANYSVHFWRTVYFWPDWVSESIRMDLASVSFGFVFLKGQFANTSSFIWLQAANK